jgi:hypothetical protein
MTDVGGLILNFELFRTVSGPWSRRRVASMAWRVTASSDDGVKLYAIEQCRVDGVKDTDAHH